MTAKKKGSGNPRSASGSGSPPQTGGGTGLFLPPGAEGPKQLIVPGQAPKALTGNRQLRRKRDKNLGVKGPKGEESTMPSVSLPGDLRFVECENPEHPLHVAGFTSDEEWVRLPDNSPIPMCLLAGEALDRQTKFLKSRAQAAMVAEMESEMTGGTSDDEEE